MSVFCIRDVQLGADGNVVAAMICQVNTEYPPQSGPWLWLEAARIVDLIMTGDQVQSTFPVQGHWVLGPNFQRKILAGGVETIELVEDQDGRRITNMRIVEDGPQHQPIGM